MICLLKTGLWARQQPFSFCHTCHLNWFGGRECDKLCWKRQWAQQQTYNGSSHYCSSRGNKKTPDRNMQVQSCFMKLVLLRWNSHLDCTACVFKLFPLTACAFLWKHLIIWFLEKNKVSFSDNSLQKPPQNKAALYDKLQQRQHVRQEKLIHIKRNYQWISAKKVWTS